ncbi:MAG: hypothetical protein MK042_11470, partial [Cognatishimia sp.]|nr:hypothetical protein [Cognatishimia sp.]
SVACLPFLVLHFLNIGADQFSGGGSITEAQELPAALERALKVIREEKRQVLLDVQVGMDDGEK